MIFSFLSSLALAVIFVPQLTENMFPFAVFGFAVSDVLVSQTIFDHLTPQKLF